MSSLKEQLKAIPGKPGVYLFKDEKGVVLYAGKAKSLRKRVSSYFTRPAEIKTSILLSRLYDIDYIITASELDALILENELIKKYKPRYNISLRDDKAYPYLKLTVNEEWPRLFMVRKKDKDGALYFGRYQGSMVREILRQVKKLFPIRWCKETPLRKREQPCLYSRIGSCSAPCVGNIDRPSYLALVKGIVLLLEGKMVKALEKLREEMEKASAEQDYERAAYLRDRIKLLEKMVEGRSLHKTPSPRLLSEVAELQRELKLERIPMRIEAFDVSNISGTNTVASMVTFYGGLPLKNEYRKFKIRGLSGKPDDVAAMRETIKRRYTGELAEKMDRPDLILVDGGAGQVGAAAREIKDIPIIGLAKKEGRLYLLNGKTLKLPASSSALQLLQRIRDEAHRFAVTYHRKRRGRALFR